MSRRRGCGSGFHYRYTLSITLDSLQGWRGRSGQAACSVAQTTCPIAQNAYRHMTVLG